MPFAEAIATVVESIAVPYGYTLAVWSAGALAVYHYGVPRIREVLYFVGGAVGGFFVFDLPTWRSLHGTPVVTVHLPSVTLLNLFPLAAVVVSTLLTRRIRRRGVGYFVAGLAATWVYIVSLALLMTFFARIV